MYESSSDSREQPRPGIQQALPGPYSRVTRASPFRKRMIRIPGVVTLALLPNLAFAAQSFRGVPHIGLPDQRAVIGSSARANGTSANTGGRGVRGRAEGEDHRDRRRRRQGEVLAYPVFAGYAPEDYDDSSQDEENPPDASAPNSPTSSVIVNQNLITDRANAETGANGPAFERSRANRFQTSGPGAVQGRSVTGQDDEQPTIYLIAFRDHRIVPALGYWIEGNTLKYVNVGYSVNQASLDLIDADLSQTLNDQRNVAFRLPMH